jgi:hypothetical protein
MRSLPAKPRWKRKKVRLGERIARVSSHIFLYIS